MALPLSGSAFEWLCLRRGSTSRRLDSAARYASPRVLPPRILLYGMEQGSDQVNGQGKGQRRQYADRGGRGGGGLPPPRPPQQAAPAADATTLNLSSPKGRKSDGSSQVSPRKDLESSRSLPSSKNGSGDLNPPSAGSRDNPGSRSSATLPPKDTGETIAAGANTSSCPSAPHAPDQAAASSGTAAPKTTQPKTTHPIDGPPKEAPPQPQPSFKDVVAARPQTTTFSNNLYMRIKLCNPSDFPRAKFYATDALHEAVLKGLAGIKCISDTGLCKPNGITIFLERLNPTALRGYFFLIGISAPGPSCPPFGKLILEAQQPTGHFDFELPITSIAKQPNAPEAKSKSKEPSSLLAKTKVSFSYDAKSLADTITLQFTITIPPLGVSDPLNDAARLLAHLIYSKDPLLKKEQQELLMAEDIKHFAAFMKPMRCNSTAFGNFQIRALTGNIPLDLDSSSSEDFHLLRRLIFGHVCGIDYRTAIHHRFYLYIPLLNDLQGLRNPLFRPIVQTHEDVLALPGISDLQQIKSKAFKRSELRSSSEDSGSSDNEAADLAAPRQAQRLAILQTLPIPARVETTTEYPNLQNPRLCSIEEAIGADTPHPPPLDQSPMTLARDPFWVCGHCVLFSSTLFGSTIYPPHPLTTAEGCLICSQQAAAFCPNCQNNFCSSCQLRLLEKAELKVASKRKQAVAPALHPVDLYEQRLSQRAVVIEPNQQRSLSSRMFPGKTNEIPSGTKKASAHKGVSFVDPSKEAHSAALSLHRELSQPASTLKNKQDLKNTGDTKQSGLIQFACMNFRKHNKCRYGDKCRHSHQPDAPFDPDYKERRATSTVAASADSEHHSASGNKAQETTSDGNADQKKIGDSSGSAGQSDNGSTSEAESSSSLSDENDSSGSDGDSNSNGSSSVSSETTPSIDDNDDNSQAVSDVNSSKISGSDTDNDSQFLDDFISTPQDCIAQVLFEIVDKIAQPAENDDAADILKAALPSLTAPTRLVIDEGHEREIPLSPKSKPNAELFVWNEPHRKWTYASNAPPRKISAPELLTPMFTVRAAAAMPTLDACRKAKKIDVKGDGQCLFSSALGAAAALKLDIGISRDMTPQQLRLIAIHFNRENRHAQALFKDANPAEAPHPLETESPEGFVKGLMPYTLAANGERCSSPTRETNYRHRCSGIRYGQLFVNGKEQKYTDLDSYLDLMSHPTAYGEDMEIMAISAIYKISIMVWTPAREDDLYQDQTGRPREALQCFYHPKSIATIVLKNTNGRGHYEYLDFSCPAEPDFVTVRRSSRGKVTADDNAPSETTMVGSPFQPLLVVLRPFPPTNAVEKFCMKQLYFPSDMAFCRCPYKQGAALAPTDLKCKCKWKAATDPWTSYPAPSIPMFAEATDKLLGTISLINFLDDDASTLAIQLSFYLHRIATMANTLYVAYIVNTASRTEQELALIRDVLVQFYDACALIQNHTSLSTADCFDAIHILSQGIFIGINDARNLVEAALSALFLSNMQADDGSNLNPSASQSSTHSVSDMDRVAAHYQECMKLKIKAIKARDMAKIKLERVLAENQMIYALQVEQLANNLSDACAEINRRISIIYADPRASSAAKDQLPLMLDALTHIEGALSDIHRVAIALRDCKAPPAPVAPASASKGRKTPNNGRRKSKSREDALLNTIDIHMHDATQSAAALARKMRNDKVIPAADSFAYLIHMPTNEAAAEDIVDPDEHADLQDAARQHSKEANSTRSAFQDDAVNVHTSGALADSFDSAVNDGSQTSGDVAFVSNSQQKSSETRHPRHLAAREVINDAVGQDPLISTSKIKDQTHTAYCRRGHVLDRRPVIDRGVRAECRFCQQMKPARELTTCNCLKSAEGPFYACDSCLQAGKSHPPPPECPSLSCVGHCLVKHFALAKTCFKCARYLPPNTRAWFCTEDQCKPVKIICIQCYNAELPSNFIPTPLPTTPAYASSPRGPPAPMPGSKGGAARK